jgi:hypothetical protein
MNKKESEAMENQFPGGSTEIDFSNDPIMSSLNIDNELVKSLENSISEKKEEIKNKVYAVSFDDKLFEEYDRFISDYAEWTSTEALGIVQVNKTIQKIKKEGIRDGVIYLGALPLEASHYFLSKSKGAGKESAESFIRLYKPLDMALSDAKSDVAEVKDLEKQLAAAMQGVTLG